MIEVFKTNVQHKIITEDISAELRYRLPGSRISFDLDDCDKVLRIESNYVDPELVVNTLKKRGFNCEILE